jgi:hypothetical protein
LIEEHQLRLAAERGLPEARQLLAAEQSTSAEAKVRLQRLAAEHNDLHEGMRNTKRNLALMQGQLAAQDAEIAEHARASQADSRALVQAQNSAKARFPFLCVGLQLSFNQESLCNKTVCIRLQ